MCISIVTQKLEPLESSALSTNIKASRVGGAWHGSQGDTCPALQRSRPSTRLGSEICAPMRAHFEEIDDS